MKFKISSFIIVLLGLLMFSSQSLAANIPISGTAYGENIGLLHMNYKTAYKPNDPIFYTAQYYIGLTKQFYVDPSDAFFDNSDQNHTFTYTPSFTASISGNIQDCSIADGCLLKGYIWSDTIGWIVLDGGIINNAMPATINVSGNDVDPYPEEMYPRIKMNNGALTGLAWNAATGWIMFSNDSYVLDLSNPIMPTGSNTIASNQIADIDANDEYIPATSDWGVFLDSNDLTKFKGYAWSEHVGWIKFGEESDEETTFDFGAYTRWIPDVTPPDILAPNTPIWFAVGVNSGYDQVTQPTATTIVWTHFAEDQESGISIDPALTSLTLTVDTNTDFIGCPSSFPSVSKPSSNALDADITFPNIGLIRSQPRGYCKYLLEGNVSNGIGNAPLINPVTIYVRAGNYDQANSNIDLPNGTSAIADGVDTATLEVELKDLAGNPIVSIPVNCDTGSGFDCPERIVTVTAQITNELAYDVTEISNIDTPLTPVMSNGAWQEVTDNSDFLDHDNATDNYLLNVVSFAPSNSYPPLSTNPNSKKFNITRLDYEILNTDLPSTNTDSSYDQSTANRGDDSDEFIVTPALSPSTPISFNFSPAIITNNQTVLEGVSQGTVLDGQLIRLSYDIVRPGAFIPSGSNGGLSIDTIFAYGGNASRAALETQSIDVNPSDVNLSTTEESPAILGWKDPDQTVPQARFEIYEGKDVDGSNLEGDTSPFVGEYSLDGTPIANISSVDGSYPISGSYGIPHPFEPDQDGNYADDGIIDRSDKIPLSTLSSIELAFIPQKVLPGIDVSGVDLGLRHEIAYQYPGQLLFTRFAQRSFQTFDIRSIGLEAIGTVAGEQRVTGRKFETVGTTSTKKLQEQIRRNVARLTLNITSPCRIPSAEITSFKDATDLCVFEEVPGSSNGPLYAYYEGGSSETLVLDNSDAGLVALNRPYTIILKGGANLFIKDNIYYNTTVSPNLSSLGFILIAEEIGNGADVFISPDPTNIVGSLYAEGSLLSKSTANQAVSDLLYYGQAGGNVGDLKNQLYWQGSIASRNTIGGAALKEFPDRAQCDFAVETALSCAQRYDLDYLRRFAVVIDSTNNKSYISGNGLFSGGGSCDSNGICSRTGSLPSVIDLSTTNYIITDPTNPNASETAPFFIEKHQRAINNPPPGFTVTTGIESYQEIR